MPRIENDIKLDFKDVLLRPKRSTLKSRSEVDLMRSFTFRNSKGSYRGIPIIAANMDTVGTFEMALALHQSVAVSTGTGDGDFEKISAIVEALPQLKYICVDVANGYSEHFVHFVKDVRQKFPSHTIMVSAGADFVMLGGMLAGHSESGGETIEKNGKKYKLFYGMSSDTAMKKHTGGICALSSCACRASEGKTVEVSFKGPVDETIRDVLGGVRSTCTYVGAGKLKELSRRTTFIRVTQQLNTVFGNC
ncbi:hypothetical protein GOODEAATRI_002573 [Goodea atripinnis]|uniref:GMP reductase n=1 Tax=Goodea atripinnis TaxID=208336 RepID=A0ABV0MFK3_9TELE